MPAVPEVPVEASATPAPGFFQKNKIWLIVIGVFILSNLSVYLYQRHQHKRLLKACREELDRKSAEGRAMTLARSEEIASNLCRTLVWGLRGEMDRGNKGDIDQFINKMVQETGLDLVIIQNSSDSIYLSTDKKYENHKVPYVQGVIDRQQIVHSDAEEVAVAAPIMGLERRLGSCLIVYKPTKETRDQLREMERDSLPGEVREPMK